MYSAVFVCGRVCVCDVVMYCIVPIGSDSNMCEVQLGGTWDYVATDTVSLRFSLGSMMKFKCQIK